MSQPDVVTEMPPIAPEGPPCPEPTDADKECTICLESGEGVKWRAAEFACVCVGCRFHDACWAQFTANASHRRPTRCPICRKPTTVLPPPPPAAPTGGRVLAAVMNLLLPYGFSALTAVSLLLLLAAIMQAPLRSPPVLAHIAASAAIILSEYAYQFFYFLRDWATSATPSWAERLEREFAITWYTWMMVPLRAAWAVYSAWLYAELYFKAAPLLGVTALTMTARMAAKFVALAIARASRR